MAIKLVKNDKELTDIFGDTLTITTKGDDGKDERMTPDLAELVKLFIRNLGNFYAVDKKQMPFEDSEHALNVARGIRDLKNGYIEMYDDDYNWLMKLVEAKGTMLLGDDAVILRDALKVLKEPEAGNPEGAE